MAKKAANANRRRSGQRRSRARAGATRPRQTRAPRPLPQADNFATPDASPLRETVERKSATALVLLHRMPRWVPMLVIFGLLTAGLALKGVLGGALIIVLVAILGWLAYISWPTLTRADRTFRSLALIGAVGLAVYFIAAT
ncbi:MAG: DUF6703 family protein [Streptosporangiales bacterium]